MGTISFISADGNRTAVEGRPGVSIMQIAVDARVPGIVGECGGTLSCATCHCYLENGWDQRVAPPSADEQIMVDCAIDPETNSRLTCQLIYNDEMDGIELRIPASQY